MSSDIRRVETTSENPLADRIEQLKALFPEAVTETGIDFPTLANLLGGEVRTPDRYSFTWAGKQEAILSLQRQTEAALHPVPEESVNWDTTKHLFIEGDNLEVLKLLYKSYNGRVKMIYIDPPYNTGNEFVYPDDYSDPLSHYLRLTGQLDDGGEPFATTVEVNGKKHSRWLTMMYPRLFMARQLLRDDGVIFVSIDDTEVANLRLLMDQIFGEENFVTTIIWEKKYSPQNDAQWFSDNHDYVLLYARHKELWKPNLLERSEIANSRYSNPDSDPRGDWKSSDLSVRTYTRENDYPITAPSGRIVMPPEGRAWVVTETRYFELLADNRIWFGESGNNVPALKKFLTEVRDGMIPLTIWPRSSVGDTQDARKSIRDIFGTTSIFDTPKPVSLIKRMIDLSTNDDEQAIVLDFFAGSGTTGEAVLEQNRTDGGNRKFVVVQLPEQTPRDSPVQLSGFHNIAEISKERIRRVIQRMRDENNGKLEGIDQVEDEDLGFRVFRLERPSIRPWPEMYYESTTPEQYMEQLDLYATDSLFDGWNDEKVIAEVALKEVGFGLSYHVEHVERVTEHKVYKVSDAEKAQYFYICLDDQLTLDGLEPLNIQPEDLLVFRDKAVDDTIIANLVLHSRILTI